MAEQTLHVRIVVPDAHPEWAEKVILAMVRGWSYGSVGNNDDRWLAYVMGAAPGGWDARSKTLTLRADWDKPPNEQVRPRPPSEDADGQPPNDPNVRIIALPDENDVRRINIGRRP